jgi:hypothetical protein
VFALALSLVAQGTGADEDSGAIALSRGLSYLAARQKDDGSVGEERFRGGVGVTSLAGLALMAGEAHTERVKRIAKFLLSCQKGDGFIVAEGARAGSMYDHGYATLFLAEHEKAARDPGVRAKLAKAVELIVKSQGKDGGWRYSPTPTDGDSSVTSCQLMALAAAKDAGVDVPAGTIAAAVGFLKRCQNPDGGFKYTMPGGTSAFPRSAAALAASLAASKWTEPENQPDAVTGVGYLMTFVPQAGALPGNRPYFYHGAYYAEQALHRIGGDAWRRWHDAVRKNVIASQQADGSWADAVSGDLATSQACLILQSRKADPGK